MPDGWQAPEVGSRTEPITGGDWSNPTLPGNSPPTQQPTDGAQAQQTGTGNIFEDLKIFDTSPADLLRAILGIPSEVIKATGVDQIPVAGPAAKYVSDAVTGQNDFWSAIMSGAWWRSAALYILAGAFMLALVWFSAASLLRG